MPVLVRQPRARAPHARADPRGVPGGRARLALARSDVRWSRVRARVDHVGERVRRPEDRSLHVAPRRRAPVGRFRGACADHAGDRWRDAADYVAKRAVTLLGSGPTGGVMGSAVAASAAGAPDFVAVDMGGTSFDICLVRGGRPEVKTDRNWRYRYYIGIPMVDVRSVGAGGGSIARVRQGALLVGRSRPGRRPGRRVTAAAAHTPPSPTPMPSSDTCRSTTSPAAA